MAITNDQTGYGQPQPGWQANASPQMQSFNTGYGQLQGGALNNAFMGPQFNPGPMQAPAQQVNPAYNVNTPNPTNPGWGNPTQFQPYQGNFNPIDPFHVGGGNFNDIMKGLMNQAQSLGQFGQQNIQDLFLGPNQIFGSALPAQFANALGLTNQEMGQLPGQMDWSQQAGQMGLQNQAGLLNQMLPGAQQAMGFLNQGLNPEVSAALQTQAMDQSANQFNNARQGVMTQLQQQGALGGGAGLPGAGMAQMTNDLGQLSVAQQQNQSQLQQQAILANQNAIEQNRGFGMQDLGMLGSLGSQFGNQALGFGGLTNNMFELAQQFPLPYMQGTQQNLNAMLQGATNQSQAGMQGLDIAANLANTYKGGTGGSLLGALGGAGISAAGSILGSILPVI